MKRISLVILVILSVTFIALLIPFIGHPDLYTIYNDSSTGYHTNPAALWVNSYERSDDIQLMMQELLDAPMSIILNIKIKDFEEAGREFEEYKEKSQYFNDVMVTLQLTESTLDDFRKENRKNMEALERIINESTSFEKVNRLEIEYRSEDHYPLMYTVVYEGEAVHNALKKSSTQFADQQANLLAISNQLNLNITKYQDSVSLVEEIVEEGQKKQENRELNRPELPTSPLTLSVSPRLGRYGDTLRVAGAYTYLNVPEEVTLVLDSKDWKTLLPDANGVFSTPLPIEMIHRGEHTIFATTGPRYSNIVTFTVVPTDTALTLETYQGEHWDEVYCQGELRTGTIPVSSAPVWILVDDFEFVSFETDQEGYYSGSLNLTKGNHTLQAVFDDATFPLNPSESALQTFVLVPTVPLMLSIGVGAGVLLIFFLGSVWYLRWRNPPAIVMESSAPSDQYISTISPISRESWDMSPSPPSKKDILIQYQILFNSGKWGGAAALLYRFIVSRITPLDHVRDPYALTPREIALQISDMSVAEPFREFITRYEEVRYGGMPLRKSDILLAYWTKTLATFEEEKEQGGRL